MGEQSPAARVLPQLAPTLPSPRGGGRTAKLADRFERGKVVDRREVAWRVAEEDIPDDPPEDLAIAGLGQAGDDVYRRGLEGLAQ